MMSFSIINGFQPLTIVTKLSVLDACEGPSYSSAAGYRKALKQLGNQLPGFYMMGNIGRLWVKLLIDKSL